MISFSERLPAGPSVHDGEHAIVGVVLSEAVVEELREEAPLPPSARLGHPVTRFLDAENSGTPVGAEVGYRDAVLDASL
eukprot:2004403-Prymnesium_polylepis.1